MSKVKEELLKLREEVGTHDALIHDIYGSLIRLLDKDIAPFLFTVLDKKGTAREASGIYDFLQAELREGELKEKRDGKNMEIEEAKKLKTKLEAKICDLLNEFTTKTGIKLEGVVIFEQIQPQTGMVEDKRLNSRVEVKTAL